MPLSISNFKKLDAKGAMALLLAALVLYFCALEIGMRTVVPQVVKAERRYGEDYRAALSLRPASPEGSKTILLVGNSLLLWGVDRVQLRETIAPSYSVIVFPIENTTYLDWYFGLRRYLAEGSRPWAIVLCLSSRQLLSNSTNGEAFAHSMMKMDDIFRVSKAAGLDNTTASNYFFANLSRWLGGRWYVRNWLLEKWLPNAESLAAYFGPRDRQARVATDIVVGEALRRLGELEELSKSNDARFVLLMPPSLNLDDSASAIQTAAALTNISVLIPYRGGEMPVKAFSDGFHLNAYGANLFTERLRSALFESLTQQ